MQIQAEPSPPEPPSLLTPQPVLTPRDTTVLAVTPQAHWAVPESHRTELPGRARCAWLFPLTVFLRVVCVVLSILLLMDIWVDSSFWLL